MKKDKGFSLLEILMAMGLFGLLTLSMMEMNKHMTTSGAKANVDLEVNDISNRVQSLLADQESCTKTLAQLGDITRDPAPTALSFKDKKNNDVNLNTDKVKILSISLGDATKTIPVPVVSISSSEGNLIVRLELERKIMGKVSTLIKWFGIKANTSDTFNITKCYTALDNAIDSACKSLGGDPTGADCLFNGKKLSSIIAELTTDCPAGATTISSPDGSNACFYSWPITHINTTAVVSVTGGGTATINCTIPGGSKGWTYSYSCPNKVTGSCPGGSANIISSPNGVSTCRFTFPQTAIGSTISLTGTSPSGTPLGSASLTCGASAAWVYNYNCNDPGIVNHCDGGSTIIPSASGASGCTCSWYPGSLGATTSASCNNGGVVSATCSLQGVWTNGSVSCP